MAPAAKQPKQKSRRFVIQDAKTSSVTAGIPNSVTPERPRKKKKKLMKVGQGEGSQPKLVFAYVIQTESAGPDGGITVVTIHQEKNKSAGYLVPINESVRQEKERKKDTVYKCGTGVNLIDEKKFDCRLHTNLFLRKSHENNEMVGLGYTSHLHRIGVIAVPNVERMGQLHKISDDDNMCIHMEKLFRDECESIILQDEERRKNDLKRFSRFVTWDPKLHSITTKPNPRPLDHIFTDQSVGEILLCYYVAKDCNHTDVYQKLKTLDVAGDFYSRNSKTGKYSKYAVQEFGYPSDDSNNDNDSDGSVNI